MDFQSIVVEFQTINGEFTDWTAPSKGRTLRGTERRLASFKKEHFEYHDLELYRTFKIELHKFWLWYEYVVAESKETIRT